MAKKTKIYTLSASGDYRLLINMLSALKDLFPKYYNRMGVKHLGANNSRNERYELSVHAEERPSDEVRTAVKVFRAGWKANAAEVVEAEAKPDSFKSKYEALRAAINRAAEGPGSVGTIKSFADSQDLSSFDAVSTALAQE